MRFSCVMGLDVAYCLKKKKVTGVGFIVLFVPRSKNVLVLVAPPLTTGYTSPQ